MTNDQYITALKKALGNLDEGSKNDILQEIHSHGAESGTSLLEQFGSPGSLAEQYLDGELLPTPITKKAAGFGKKMFFWVGILAATLVAAMVFFAWTATSDDFNYADEAAVELDQASEDWVTKPWTEGLSINIEQASAVFYWHDDSTVRWQCSSNILPNIANNTLSIRQAKCLIMVPKNTMRIVTDQAQIVLVRPQASLDMNIRQSSLRIAENETQYRYVMNSSRTNFSGLISNDDAEHTITIESLEAMISPYEKR